MAIISKNISRRCKDCYFWNRHDLTYIDKDSDCCAYWHIAYHRWENSGDRFNRECFASKNVQLTLF